MLKEGMCRKMVKDVCLTHVCKNQQNEHKPLKTTLIVFNLYILQCVPNNVDQLNHVFYTDTTYENSHKVLL